MRQGGVVRREQLTAHGFTQRQVGYRISNGEWTPIGNHAVRLFDLLDAADLVKAAASVLPGAVISHESAAEWHGMAGVETGLAVVSVHTRTTHVFPGVTVRRNHDLLDEHVVTVKGFPVTSVERTVADLAAHLDPAPFFELVDGLHASGALVVERMVEVVDAVARRGRPGSKLLRATVEQIVPSGSDESMLERHGRALLRKHGFGSFESEFPIPWSPHRRFDDADPQRRVAIEWDGRKWHIGADRFERDRKRSNEAQRHGWILLRFTWDDVVRHPARVIESVTACVRARSA